VIPAHVPARRRCASVVTDLVQSQLLDDWKSLVKVDG
jgi:hypothetical protein